MSLRVVCLLVLIPFFSFSQISPAGRLYPVYLEPGKKTEAFIDITGKIRLLVDTTYQVAETHMEMNVFHSGKCLMHKWNAARREYDYFIMNMDGKIEGGFPPGSYVGPIGGNFLMVGNYKYRALHDLERKQRSPYVYQNAVLEFSEGLAAVEQDGKMGFINESGELVLPPTHPAKSLGKNNTGKEIYFNKFKEGKAQYTADGLLGFIDREQRIAIPARFDYVQDFSDGVAYAKLPDGRSGFVDHDGKWVLGPDKKDYFGRFSSGLHKMQNADGLYGYINKKGQYVIKPAYGSATDFERGFATVADPGKENIRKIIDTLGNVKYEGYFHFAKFEDPYLILIAQEGPFAGYYASSNNFMYLDYNFKTVWSPGCDQRTITSVEVLKACDLKKVKYAWFGNDNLKTIADLKPFLEGMNLREFAIYPEERLTQVPEEIMNMTNLEELTLSFNKLESIPSSIKNLKNLKKLSLQFNNLKALPPEIYELQLHELDLRSNEFDLKTLLEIKNKMPRTKLIFKD